MDLAWISSDGRTGSFRATCKPCLFIFNSHQEGITLIRLRWRDTAGDVGLTIGDHWERAYGDLEWRGTIPNRIMPWYFFTLTSRWTAGYGVKTQPSACCFWQRDASGITLTLDLKNGGNPANSERP